MSTTLLILFFLVCLVVLGFAADHFTDAAESIGHGIGMPQFLVGATIVTLGTCLPELTSSIIASYRGIPEAVYGNVVGAIIANIVLILGAAAIAANGLKIGGQAEHIDLPFFLLAIALLVVFGVGGKFTQMEAIAALAVFIIYIIYIIATGEQRSKHLSPLGMARKINIKSVLILLISAVVVFFSAKYAIDFLIDIVKQTSIGSEVIAVSIVALGTSLPELTVGIIAARKGQNEIVVGSVLGACVFNALVTTSIPALMGDLTVTSKILYVALPVMVFVALLYLFIVRDGKISRREGVMLLGLYAAFFVLMYSV